MEPANFACAILSIALAANADTLAAVAGLSDWKYIPLERRGEGIWMGRRSQTNDFQDTRFQYRWKSERSVASYVCTIEIRPTDDLDASVALPELDVLYYDPSGLISSRTRLFTAHDVSVAKSAHATFRPPDCQKIVFVSWRK